MILALCLPFIWTYFANIISLNTKKTFIMLNLCNSVNKLKFSFSILKRPICEGNLFCMQALQSHPIIINFVLGSEHYQRQQDHSLTTTAKGSSRTQQWAQGQPSVRLSSMGRQPPLHAEHTLRTHREWALFPANQKHFSRPQDERRSALQLLWELFTLFFIPLLTPPVSLPSSPIGTNPVGPKVPTGQRGNWLRHYTACHRGADGLLSPAGALWSLACQWIDPHNVLGGSCKRGNIKWSCLPVSQCCMLHLCFILQLIKGELSL